MAFKNDGDLILDQFAGGGTTLVEAKLLNRNIIGLVIKRGYHIPLIDEDEFLRFRISE